MRELKFRSWLKNYNCYADVLGFEQGRLFVQFQSGERSQHRLYVPIEDCILEQCTGLKDKNGKEIYEGDILGDMWRDGYIAWCDKCKQLQYHILTHVCMACLGDVQWYELVNDNGKLEVVGNVHENADLLEDK